MTAELIQTQNGSLTREEFRSRVGELEQAIAETPGAIFNNALPLKHSFADGIYVREIFIPKGMLLTGKIHRHEHPNFLMQGKVTVITEAGGLQTLEAPLSMISPAGTKRVVYAHEDTIWITVHRTDKRDIDEIERDLVVLSYDQLEQVRHE